MDTAEKKTREELQADGELLVIRLKAIGYALYVVESANAQWKTPTMPNRPAGWANILPPANSRRPRS